MRSSLTNEVDQITSDAAGSKTLSELVTLAYDELLLVAASLLRSERPDPMWEPGDVVHETYIRLAHYGPDHYVSRAQFFYVAACNMRQILTDQARRRATQKRGDGWQRVPLDDLHLPCPKAPDIAAIDEALMHLEIAHPHLSRLAELRVRHDLSSREIAEAFGIGESTARKKWHIAKIHLRNKLAGGLHGGTTARPSSDIASAAKHRLCCK